MRRIHSRETKTSSGEVAVNLNRNTVPSISTTENGGVESEPTKTTDSGSEVRSSLPPLMYRDADTSGEGWITFDKPVMFLFAGKGPLVARDLMQFPVSHPDDGYIDIAIQETVSRTEMLGMIDGADAGRPFWSDKVCVPCLCILSRRSLTRVCSAATLLQSPGVPSRNSRTGQLPVCRRRMVSLRTIRSRSAPKISHMAHSLWSLQRSFLLSLANQIAAFFFHRSLEFAICSSLTLGPRIFLSQLRYPLALHSIQYFSDLGQEYSFIGAQLPFHWESEFSTRHILRYYES